MNNFHENDSGAIHRRGAFPDNHLEIDFLNYWWVYPRLIEDNHRLWSRVELADKAVNRLEGAFYDGRLEMVSVDDEPFMRTLKLIRAYLQARSCLGERHRPVKQAETEPNSDSSMPGSQQYVIALESLKRVQAENEVLQKVAWVGHWLRTDPLAMVVWYQEVVGLL